MNQHHAPIVSSSAGSSSKRPLENAGSRLLETKRVKSSDSPAPGEQNRVLSSSDALASRSSPGGGSRAKSLSAGPSAGFPVNLSKPKFVPRRTRPPMHPHQAGPSSAGSAHPRLSASPPRASSHLRPVHASQSFSANSVAPSSPAARIVMSPPSALSSLLSDVSASRPSTGPVASTSKLPDGHLSPSIKQFGVSSALSTATHNVKRRSKYAAAHTPDTRELRRLSQIEKHMPVVAEMVKKLVEQQQAQNELVEAAAQDGRERLQVLVDLWALRNRHLSRPIKAHDCAVLQEIRQADDLLDTLYRIATDPHCYDPRTLPCLTSSASSQVTPTGDSDDVRVHGYLRIRRETVRALCVESRPYGELFPAEREHEQAYRDWIESRYEKDELINRTYGGISRLKTGVERAMDDAGSDAATRYSNYLRANDFTVDDLDCYDFVLDGDVWLVGGAGMHHDLIAHPLASDFESLLLSFFGLGRLNSAHGGLRPLWTPSLTLIRLRDAVESTSINLHDTPPPDVPHRTSRNLTGDDEHHTLLYAHDRRRIAEHFRDMQTCLDRADLDTGERVPDDVLDMHILHSSAFQLTSDGYHNAARALKDITRAEFFGASTGSRFYNKRAGHGPWAHRVNLAFVHRQSDTEFDEDDPQLLDRLQPIVGCFVDLWIVLVHRELVVAIIFWLRFFVFVSRSPTIVVTSSKLAQLLVSGKLPSFVVEQSAAPDPWSEVMERLDSTRIDEIIGDPQVVDWHDLPLADFINHVGSLLVVELLPGHWKLALLQLHVGILKYDPVFELPLRELMVGVELKGRLMQDVAAHHCYAESEEGVIALRQAVETICAATGLTEYIESTRADIQRQQAAIRGLRALRSNLNDEDKCEDEDEEGETRRRLLGQRLTEGAKKWRDTTEVAEGQANSQIRADQIERLLRQFDHDVKHGRASFSSVPTPANTSVGDDVWKKWVLALDPGKILASSAAAYCYQRSPLDNLSKEALAAYYDSARTRQLHLRREFTSAQEPLAVMTALDDELKSRATEQTGFLLQKCRACGGEALGSHNLGHRCSAVSAAGVASTTDSTAPTSRPGPSHADASHTFYNRRAEASFSNATSDVVDKYRLYYPSDVLSISPVMMPDAWTTEPALDIALRNQSALAASSSAVQRFLNISRDDCDAKAQIGNHLGMIVYTSPSIGNSQGRERWLCHQALERVLVAVAESTTYSQPPIPAGIAETYWTDASRLPSVYSIAAAAAAHAKVAAQTSEPFKRHLELKVCENDSCTDDGPCTGRTFGAPGLQVRHVNATKGRTQGKVAAVFASFFELPIPLIRRAHLSTIVFTEKVDKGTKAFETAGRVRPEWWS